MTSVISSSIKPSARASSQVTPKTIWTIALHALVIASVLFVLSQARTVVAWVAVAMFLALALDPAVSLLHRRGLRRGLAVLLVLLVAVVIVTVLVATFVPMLVQQGQSLIAAGPDLLERLHSRLVAITGPYFGGDLDLIARARSELQAAGPDVAAPVLGVVAGFFQGLVGIVTVTVLTVFMLLFGREVIAQLLEWVEPQRRAHMRELAGRMKQRVGGYVAGSLFIALIGGVVTAVGLLLLGVPFFLPLGLVMAILGVIPFVGPAVGAVVVVGATFAAAGVKAGVIAAIGFALYQQAENHLLQPLIQRRTIRMNPLIITLVMLFGTALTGVLGALLALPVAGAVQVLLQDVLDRRRARWTAPPTAPMAAPLPAAADPKPQSGPPRLQPTPG